jgi:hypothetical protein
MPFAYKDAVRTLPKLSRRDFIGPKDSKAQRKPNMKGTVSGTFGEELYVVEHLDKTTALYFPDELEIDPDAFWRVNWTQSGIRKYIEMRPYAIVLLFLIERELDESPCTVIEVHGPFSECRELKAGFIDPTDIYEELKNEDF